MYIIQKSIGKKKKLKDKLARRWKILRVKREGEITEKLSWSVKNIEKKKKSKGIQKINELFLHVKVIYLCSKKM